MNPGIKIFLNQLSKSKMDISKAQSISGDYRDRRSSTNWESLIFAEVVFLDKTHASAKPRLYQLKDSALSDSPPPLINSNAFSFSGEAFVLLGEMTTIDKKKKQIQLSNKNTVSYQYLVIVSGSKPILTFQEPEFAVGLQTLVDALRVKTKIPPSFPMLDRNPFQKNTAKCCAAPQKDIFPYIEKFVQPNADSAGSISGSFDLNALNKRLYEIQL